jgi:hypothetical protein
MLSPAFQLAFTSLIYLTVERLKRFQFGKKSSVGAVLRRHEFEIQ